MVVVVPLQIVAHPVVHADVQVQHHHHRGLQPVRQVECLHGQFEALVGIGREQQHVAGVTVGGIGSRKDIGLLGTRRHAGGRADALHVEEHRREFGEIGIADELAHERQPGSAGRREGPRPVPGGAEHDTDGRQFIFRLDDAVVACARFAIDPVPLAKRLERIHQRSGRRDGIPRTHRRPGKEATQRRRRVAVDHDLAVSRVHPLDTRRQRTVEVLAGVVGAQLDGVHVRLQQRLLGCERPIHGVLDHLAVQFEQ